jgi:polyisoprenoid-binding protein YceI
MKAIRFGLPGLAGSTAQAFQIVPQESQARFVIDEVLQGAPKTVVGTTDQVAGQIVVDPADLDTVQVGTILINARTFATDSTQRDRMIQNQILKTAQNEYITFTPTRMVGLPDSAAVGQPFTFQMIGDLTIRGTTRPVELDVAFEGLGTNPWGKEVIGFSARTEINRKDFGLTWNVALETGGLLVSEQVKIQLEVQAVRA